MSQQFAAEQCPNCKGTKLEPGTTHDCNFCKGAGLVSHFKLATWKLTHLDELDPDELPETDPAPVSNPEKS